MIHSVSQYFIHSLISHTPLPTPCPTLHSGRRDPNIPKALGLNIALGPTDWNRTLEVGQKAKDLGIVVTVASRGQDVASEENFKKLSSGGFAWFGEEKELIQRVHRMFDSGALCEMIKIHPKVRVLLGVIFN